MSASHSELKPAPATVAGPPQADEPIFYLNGEFVPQSQAKVSLMDHSVLYGDGVFDSCFCWEGKIHKLDAHLDRLYRGAQALGLTVPLEKPAFAEAIIETVRRNGLRTAYIKPIVSRGVGFEPRLDPRGCTPMVAILVGPWLHLVDPKQERGMKVRTSAVRRIPAECLDPRIKSLNYLNIILARLDATSAGADDGLMLDLQGRVCEGPGYNVFAARNGVLYTPRESILEGITRQTLLEICEREGIAVQATDLWPYDLYTADEVFYCSSSVAIVGVVELDGRRIGSGAPGPLTRRLYDLFMRELTEGNDLTEVFP